MFELDPAAGELRKHGVRVRLQEQPFRVLTALLEKPGEIVSREELVRRIWPDGTFVEFERSLNAAVNRLRQTLGDSAEAPRYIETLARRGYRFIGPVKTEQETGAAVAPPVSASEPATRTRKFAFRTRALIAAAAVVAASIGYLLLHRERDPGFVLENVTSDVGLTTDPALSADGKLLAYSSDRNSNNLNIWVQQLAGGGAIQLTHGAEDESTPSFSPDGKRIVYRSEREGGGLYIVDALGGEPRFLAAGGRDPRFSPDGKKIAYWVGYVMGQYPNAIATGRVFVVASEGGEPVEIGRDLDSEVYPVWAPDSRRLLVFRNALFATGVYGWDWWIVPLDGSKAVRTHGSDILSKYGFLLQPVAQRAYSWAGDSLLFSAQLGDSVNVWQARFRSNGTLDNHLSRVTSGTNIETNAVYGANGTVAFAALTRDSSLYAISGNANTGSFAQVRRLTSRSGADLMPSISTDGRIVAFTCDKGNHVCTKDMLTGEEHTLTNGPNWQPVISHDGSRIAYAHSVAGTYRISIIPARGGMPDQVVEKGGWTYDWFHDARRFLFRSNPAPEIYVADSATKRITLFASQPGRVLYQTRLSPDDHWVALESVSSATDSRLYIAPLTSGAAGAATEWIPVGFAEGWDDKPRWSPNGALLYFMSEHDGFRCIWAQRLDSVTKRPRGASFAVYHFHNARLSMMNVGLANLGIAVGPNSIVLDLGELRGNIWIRRRP